jgi:beta-lactamase superfamily II metal-dependent hydrolase
MGSRRLLLGIAQDSRRINDNSIAFILQYKHFRVLFTGDAGVTEEQRFLNEGIDLSSPPFIAAVHPRYW